MMVYAILIAGVIGVLALLIGAIVWTIRLGIAVAPPGDIVTSQITYGSFRLFPGPDKTQTVLRLFN